MGEGALDRVARSGCLGLEQTRFHVLYQGKHTLVGPRIVAVEVDQLLHARAGYRLQPRVAPRKHGGLASRPDPATVATRVASHPGTRDPDAHPKELSTPMLYLIAVV